MYLVIEFILIAFTYSAHIHTNYKYLMCELKGIFILFHFQSGAKLFENCTIEIPEELDDGDDDEAYELDDI